MHGWRLGGGGACKGVKSRRMTVGYTMQARSETGELFDGRLRSSDVLTTASLVRPYSSPGSDRTFDISIMRRDRESDPDNF